MDEKSYILTTIRILFGGTNAKTKKIKECLQYAKKL